MSNYTNLKLTIDNHIAVLTLNNPPAHTWTKESLVMPSVINLRKMRYK